MDEATTAPTEMTLRCAECGHMWQARTAVYCPRCGGAELYQQTAWPAEAILPPRAEDAA